jgi:hypothetical protein
LVIARRGNVEKMMRHEIEAAAREILGFLDAHGDAPVMGVKNALGKRELYFYMGLGDLILEHRVAIQEREGVFWAVRATQTAKAA